MGARWSSHRCLSTWLTKLLWLPDPGASKRRIVLLLPGGYRARSMFPVCAASMMRRHRRVSAASRRQPPSLFAGAAPLPDSRRRETRTAPPACSPWPLVASATVAQGRCWRERRRGEPTAEGQERLRRPAGWSPGSRPAPAARSPQPAAAGSRRLPHCRPHEKIDIAAPRRWLRAAAATTEPAGVEQRRAQAAQGDRRQQRPEVAGQPDETVRTSRTRAPPQSPAGRRRSDAPASRTAAAGGSCRAWRPRATVPTWAKENPASATRIG